MNLNCERDPLTCRCDYHLGHPVEVLRAGAVRLGAAIGREVDHDAFDRARRFADEPVRLVSVNPMRYERVEPSRGPRVRVALAILAVFLLLGAGLALQARWDRACAAEHPGTRWNGDLWTCEATR